MGPAPSAIKIKPGEMRATFFGRSWDKCLQAGRSFGGVIFKENSCWIHLQRYDLFEIHVWFNQSKRESEKESSRNMEQARIWRRNIRFTYHILIKITIFIYDSECLHHNMAVLIGLYCEDGLIFVLRKSAVRIILKIYTHQINESCEWLTAL